MGGRREGAGGARWMKSARPVNFQDAMQPSHAAVLGRNVAAHRVESCLHHHHHDVRGRRHQLAQHSNLVTCELCDITMAKDEWEQRKKGARHRRNTAASRLSLKGGPACSVSRPAISCRHNAARGYGPSKSQLGQWCSERGERKREREREREPFPHVSTALPTEGAIAPSVLIARQVHASDSDPEAPIFGRASTGTPRQPTRARCVCALGRRYARTTVGQTVGDPVGCDAAI